MYMSLSICQVLLQNLADHQLKAQGSGAQRVFVRF